MAGDLIGEELLIADGAVGLDPQVGRVEVALELGVLHVNLQQPSPLVLYISSPNKMKFITSPRNWYISTDSGN